MILQVFVQVKIIFLQNSVVMMAGVSDNSNRNCGDLVGVGEAERIASNLISRLLLVYFFRFFFFIYSLETCVVLVCVLSLV